MNSRKNHNKRIYHSQPDQRGIALVLVMWILALLTAIAAEVAYSMRTEINIVRNFKEATQASFVARAGMNLTISALTQKPRRQHAENSSTTAGMAKPRINHINPPQPFESGAFLVRLENINGRIDLNRAGTDLLNLLVDHLEISQREKATIVDSILDWRDDDDFHRLNGAENNYYRTLPTPYPCRNGAFTTVEELRLVKGITPDIYIILRPMIEAVPLQVDKENEEALYAMPESGSPSGNAINLNAASPEVLGLLPMIGAGQIERIQLFRKDDDFIRYSQIREVVGAEVFTAIEPHITLALSPFYIIRVEGRVTDSSASQTIKALVKISPGSRKKYAIMRLEEEVF